MPIEKYPIPGYWLLSLVLGRDVQRTSSPAAGVWNLWFGREPLLGWFLRSVSSDTVGLHRLKTDLHESWRFALRYCNRSGKKH